MSYVIPFVLIVHTLIAAALVGVILLQRSEGGALGIGQTTGGLVSARGAADLLTRSTSILGAVFVITSLGLAVLYGHSGKTRVINPNAASVPAPLNPGAPRPVPTAPAAPGGVPIFGGPSEPASPLEVGPTQPPVTNPSGAPRGATPAAPAPAPAN
ncbi:MAG: preprotein translocase subunit SecG [Sphingomonadaceae bacterium]|nr:preprotein translocase subunit SecG [Sphingomonadaceae bacterium]